MTRLELQRQVEEAFRDAKYPSDDDLIGHPSDPQSHDLESNEVRQAFGQKSWTEITQKHLVDMPQVISFLAPGAFAYYMPAIILATLDFTPETAYFRENFIRRLTPREGKQQAFQEVVALLTSRQKSVVSEYLRFVTQEAYGGHPVGEAEIALERYWNRFQHY